MLLFSLCIITCCHEFYVHCILQIFTTSPYSAPIHGGGTKSLEVKEEKAPNDVELLWIIGPLCAAIIIILILVLVIIVFTRYSTKVLWHKAAWLYVILSTVSVQDGRFAD